MKEGKLSVNVSAHTKLVLEEENRRRAQAVRQQ